MHSKKSAFTILFEMTKGKIFGVAILLLSFYSCNSSVENTDLIWKDLDFVDLHGEVMPTDSLPLPYRIVVSRQESLLFVVNRQGNNNGYISVYDLNSGKFIKSFLKSGAGPDELLHVGHLQILGQELIVFGTLEKRLLVYDLKKIRGNEVLTSTRIISIKSNSVRSPYFVNEDLIVDTRFNFKEDSLARLDFYNGKGELIRISGSFPEASMDLEPIHLTESYRSFIGVGAGQIVLTNAYTDLVEVYSAEGGLVARQNGPDYFSPVMEPRESGGGLMIAPTANTRRAYSFVSVGSGGFLAFYSGELNSKSRNNKDRFILFSADGTPLKSYSLDIPILHFDVDWETKTVYGVTDQYRAGGQELAVIKYKL